MKNKKSLILLGIAAASLSAMTGCAGSRTIDLNKYIKISSTGINTVGTASYSFDYIAFEKDYNKLRKKNYPDCYSFLDSYVHYELDEYSNLENGDVITLKWDCQDELLKEQLKVNLEYSDIEYTVENLEQPTSFDPFEYLEVVFDGTSPQGFVNLNPIVYDAIGMENIKFTADKEDNLKNGDKITVTASYLNCTPEQFVQTYGTIMGTTEKTYTCNSLKSYATKIEDIPEDTLNQMISQGNDTARSYVASYWDNPSMMQNITYIGNYFLSSKPDMNNEVSNYIYMIYRIDATAPESKQPITNYYYVRFENALILSDGTCDINLGYYTTPQYGWFEEEGFQVDGVTFVGYENLESLFNRKVISQIDKYEYSDNITE